MFRSSFAPSDIGVSLRDDQINDLLARLKAEGSVGPFKSVPTVDAKTNSVDQLIATVQDGILHGIPVVIQNSLEAWRSNQPRADDDASVSDDALFNLDWLREHENDTALMVRNVCTGEDVEFTMGAFVEYLREKTPEERRGEGRLLYGKDIICPNAWTARTNSRVPPYFQYKGQTDLVPLLPEHLQPDNLMAYIGFEGTLTPGHTDLCGSVGHNIMVHADEGARAIWFMAESGSLEPVSQFWHEHGQSIYEDNYFAPLDVLEKAPFTIYVIEQKLGDFVLVPPEAAHQVYNMGGVNIKVSWNRVTVDSLRRCVDRVLSEYRVHMRPEIYRIKAIVHHTMLHMTGKAPSMRGNQGFIEDFRIVIECFASILKEEWVEGVPEHLPTLWTDADRPHMRTCDFCRADIWNRGFNCLKCATGYVGTFAERAGIVPLVPYETRTATVSKIMAAKYGTSILPPSMSNVDTTTEESTAESGQPMSANANGEASQPNLNVSSDDLAAKSKDKTTNGVLLPTPENEPESGYSSNGTLGKAHSEHGDGTVDVETKMEVDGGVIEGEDEFDICLDCYAKGRSCPHEKCMTFHEYIPMRILSGQLRSACKAYNDIRGSQPQITQEWVNSFFDSSSPTVTTGTVAYDIYLQRTEKVKTKAKCCHACRSSVGSAPWTFAADSVCGTPYCARCLWNRFGIRLHDVKKERNWACPKCQGICNCLNCLKKWDNSQLLPFPKPSGEILFLCEQAHYMEHRHGNVLVYDRQYPTGPVFKDNRYKVEEAPAIFKRVVLGRMRKGVKRPLDEGVGSPASATPGKAKTPATRTKHVVKEEPTMETRSSRRKSVKDEVVVNSPLAAVDQTPTPSKKRKSGADSRKTLPLPSSVERTTDDHDLRNRRSSRHTPNNRQNNSSTIKLTSLTAPDGAPGPSRKAKTPRLKLQSEGGADRSCREILMKMDLDPAFLKEYFVETMGLVQEKGGLWAGVHAENTYNEMLGISKP